MDCGGSHVRHFVGIGGSAVNTIAVYGANGEGIRLVASLYLQRGSRESSALWSDWTVCRRVDQPLGNAADMFGRGSNGGNGGIAGIAIVSAMATDRPLGICRGDRNRRHVHGAGGDRVQ